MAKLLKIGLVLDTSLDPSDGVQQYVLAIGAWLTSQGHEVHYLVGETNQRELDNLHSLSKNIAVQFNGNRTTIPLPTSSRKLRNFLSQHDFDVLHVQVPHSPFMAHRLVKQANKNTAVIGTFHILPYGWLPRVGNHLLGIWLKSSLDRFDKMLAVSPAAADFAKRSFKVEAEVLPNVFDYNRYNNAKPIPKYKDDSLNILFLGRLVKRKGCLQLLKAVSELDLDHLPQFRVIICGNGHLRPSLEKFVKEHGLSEQVEFVGFVSEDAKPGYFASADIAIFPSSGGESFGIVLLEAMASDRGVVLAGDNPGYRSVMEQQPDLLFDPLDSDALAQKIAKYLTDGELRHSKAKWGSDYTQAFDTDVVGKKLLNIYRAALLKRQKL